MRQIQVPRSGRLNYSVWLIAFAISILAHAKISAAPSDVLVEWSGLTMGPIGYKVIVRARTDSETEAVQKEVATTLDRINASMSTYIPTSEVSRFNSSTSLDWFPVSEELALVVQRSLEVSRDSNGAFDVTVKPLVELWNFGAGKGEFHFPNQEQVDLLRNQIGWEHLEVRTDPPALKKSLANLQIDLSAIAKGYAVDAVSQVLSQAGFANHFVEIGGEVVARGIKSANHKWKVGIERPQDNGQQIDRIVDLSDCAIATSGDYRNFVIVEGKRYSHEIDPETGRPADNQVASVSIIANDCMTADALATAVMVLGAEPAQALCKKYSAEFLLLKREGAGFSEQASPGFNAFTARSDSTNNPIVPVFVGALLLFSLAMAGLLFGAVFAKRPLKGSCGGLSTLAGNPNGNCGLCGGPVSACPEPTKTGTENTSNPDQTS